MIKLLYCAMLLLSIWLVFFAITAIRSYNLHQNCDPPKGCIYLHFKDGRYGLGNGRGSIFLFDYEKGAIRQNDFTFGWHVIDLDPTRHEQYEYGKFNDTCTIKRLYDEYQALINGDQLKDYRGVYDSNYNTPICDTLKFNF